MCAAVLLSPGLSAMTEAERAIIDRGSESWEGNVSFLAL